METRTPLPLEGVRVADFSWFGAGPISGQVLANFGAEVIRIESEAHLDNLRRVMPVPPGKEGPNVSGYYNNFNAGKLSFTLNMGRPEARDLALELLSTCDIMLENYTPRIMQKWGLTYAEVARVRPDIIYVNVPMQGSWGPHRDYLGFGAVLAPLAGYSYMSGWPDRAPIGIGTNYPDFVVNPSHSVVAIVAALRHRDLTGEGQQIELAQIESTINGLGLYLLEYQVNGELSERNGNRCDYAAPHGAFPCAGDDRWCVIAVFEDRHWEALKTAMGRPAWAEEERFSTLLDRKRHEDELEQRIGGWTRGLAAEAVAEVLQAHGVPAGVLQNAEDVLDRDPHVKARGFYVYLDHPEAGHNAYDGPHFRLSATPGRVRAPAPMLGQHVDYVLGSLLGVGDERTAELLVNQVVF